MGTVVGVTPVAGVVPVGVTVFPGVGVPVFPGVAGPPQAARRSVLPNRRLAQTQRCFPLERFCVFIVPLLNSLLSIVSSLRKHGITSSIGGSPHETISKNFRFLTEKTQRCQTCSTLQPHLLEAADS
jgi:hypothetical protein